MRIHRAWIVLAGGLALAAAAVYRLQRASSPSARESTTVRIAAFDQQIDAYEDVDASQILFRETGAIVPEGFTDLSALAVDRQDRIYAGGADVLAVFTPEGEEVRRWNAGGPVTCMAVDGQGHVFVGLGNAVRVFDAAGVPLAVFEGVAADARITSLAVVDEHVFAADARSRTVIRFTPEGRRTLRIDGRGEGADAAGFVIPSPSFDIAAGQGRTLWVVNPGRHRLEEYNPDGVRIHAWQGDSGLELEAFSGCCNPAHIALLGDGSLVTSEKGLPRVKVYSRRGAFVGVVAGPRQFDRRDLVPDIAVDSRDRILVADAAQMRIRIFERLADTGRGLHERGP